jgi:hypothetical protein
MLSTDRLHGRFVECCDCFTICPCWVHDRPDEDHCSSLYIWTFGEGAQIKGKSLAGKSVAAVAFHGNRGGMQSAIYADMTLDEETINALYDTFFGKPQDEDSFVKTDKKTERAHSLGRLLGTIVDHGPAKITHKYDKAVDNAGWEVTVEVEGSRLAHASGHNAKMEGRSQPLTLNDTALHDEMGIDGAVGVQEVTRFEMAVSPLPGGPFVYSGRSGMAAKFDYSKS